MPEQISLYPKVTLKKDLVSHPLLTDKFNAQRDPILEQTNLFVTTLEKERQTVSFKNPFDIPRHRLVQQVARMRNNLLQSDWVVQDQDSAHSLPISQMGNYQEYLKRQTPQLREIESAPVRQHMFGNPFKIDKRMMVSCVFCQKYGLLKSIFLIAVLNEGRTIKVPDVTTETNKYYNFKTKAIFLLKTKIIFIRLQNKYIHLEIKQHKTITVLPFV